MNLHYPRARAYPSFPDPELPDPELPDPAAACHAAHYYARLTQIKRRSDPDRLLHFPSPSEQELP